MCIFFGPETESAFNTSNNILLIFAYTTSRSDFDDRSQVGACVIDPLKEILC